MANPTPNDAAQRLVQIIRAMMPNVAIKGNNVLVRQGNNTVQLSPSRRVLTSSQTLIR